MKADKPQYSYKQFRTWLLEENFVLNVFAKELSKRISKLNKKRNELEVEKVGIPDEIQKVIHNVADYLKIEPITIQALIKDESSLILRSDVVELPDDIFSPGAIRKGTYVRFDPEFTLKEWIEKYKSLSNIGAFANEVRKLRGESLIKTGGRRKQVGYMDNKNAQIYIGIERQIAKYWKRKISKPDDYDADSGVSVVDGSIEEYIKDMPEEEKDKIYARYKGIYYDVAKRYKLPTLQKLQKVLQFLD